MIEKIIYDFLTKDKSLPTCGFEFKEGKKEQLVIERVGGDIDYISRAVFAVQVYGGSVANTAKLAKKVALKIPSLAEDRRITSAKVSTIQNFADLTRKLQRYQLLVEIYYYEREEIA